MKRPAEWTNQGKGADDGRAGDVNDRLGFAGIDRPDEFRHRLAALSSFEHLCDCNALANNPSAGPCNGAGNGSDDHHPSPARVTGLTVDLRRCSLGERV